MAGPGSLFDSLRIFLSGRDDDESDTESTESEESGTMLNPAETPSMGEDHDHNKDRTTFIQGKYGFRPAPIPFVQQAMASNPEMFNKKLAAYQEVILNKDKSIKTKIDDLTKLWTESKPVSSKINPLEAMDKIRTFETSLNLLKQNYLRNSEVKTAMEISAVGRESDDMAIFDNLTNEMEAAKDSWYEIEQATLQLEGLRGMQLSAVQPKRLRKQLENLSTNLLKVPDNFKESEGIIELNKKIDHYKEHMGLIMDLQSVKLKPHHVTQLKKKTNLNLTDPTLTLDILIDTYLIKYSQEIREILVMAQGENSLQEFLKQIIDTWEEYKFTLAKHPTSKSTLVTAFDPLTELLNEHISCISAMKLSPYFKKLKDFEEQAKQWEVKLNTMMALIDLWISVQRRWVYLGSIFTGTSDLRNILVQEYKKFSNVSTEFLTVMKKVEADPKPIKVIVIPNITKTFDRFNIDLESIQKALGDYLEKQRASFPRFYFIGDEDMLEIFGHSKELNYVTRHLKKMFAGLSSLEYNQDGTIISCLLSKENERVPLLKNIVIEKSMKVNDWLALLEIEMCSALAGNLKEACKKLTDKSTLTNSQALTSWTDKYAAQLLNVAAQIEWSSQVDDALRSKQRSKLESILKSVEVVLGILATLVLENQPDLRRAKLEYLIIEYVHQRDVIRDLLVKDIKNESDFVWLSQMRFYFNPSAKTPGETILINIADSVANYGFEYLGIQEKLVQTPLTDRCYLTMTQALNQRLGGSPFGPAGTGKTESVKALGIQLGTFVLVFNCDEAFNFLAMGRIFVGLCQVGAWGCFDEFNRLEEGVLSAVSQQIQTIQEGLKLMMTESNIKVELLDRMISLNPRVAVFITMNPGYAGRSNLPNNLKQLFRGLAMTQPDRQLIAQVMLYSQGFVEAERLSMKVVPLFKLCSEQLSAQPHYDFGLRALKSVLRSAGGLKRRLSTKVPFKVDSKEQKLSRKISRLTSQENMSNAGEETKKDGGKPAAPASKPAASPKSKPAASPSGKPAAAAAAAPATKPEAAKKEGAKEGEKKPPPPPLPTISKQLSKRESKREPAQPVKPLTEQEILIQSIMETISPKLVSDDVPLLDSLMKDVFPDNTYKPADIKGLQDYLGTVCQKECLIYSFKPGEEGFLWSEKILQFYLINNINHGIMLVGPSGTGKTKARKCLLKALGLWEGSHGVAHVINPKSIPKEQLYGMMDPNTREWNDGVFTHVLRNILTHIEENPNELQVRHWIIFDGDVDPEWVENLNSVLDDNKLLTLPNGERLQITPNVRIIFEVQDLKFATLATVSRCGMVWFSEEVMPCSQRFNGYFQSLRQVALKVPGVAASEELLKVQGKIADILEPYFEKGGLVESTINFGATLFHIMEYTNSRIISSLLCLVSDLIKEALLTLCGVGEDDEEAGGEEVAVEEDVDISTVHTFLTGKFLLQLVWAIGGDSNWDVRKKISDFVRDNAKEGFPSGVEGNLLDYDVGKEGDAIHCSTMVPEIKIQAEQIVATDVVVPTIDTVRHEALLVSMLREKRPLILCGPPGSGKTMTLFCALRSFPEMEVVGMNFSCATTPEFLISTMDQYCEYRKTTTGYLMVPKAADKILIFFCDECNLPNMDNYHTIRVITFIRDLVEKNYFWRVSDKQMVTLDRILFVGACNPPTDPGRKPLSLRFLSLVSLIYVDYPGEEAYLQIYGTLAKAMLRQFANLKDFCEPLVQAMVTFYLQTQIKFTADVQPHYIYSPRELTRWIKGLYMALCARKECSQELLVRLWFHEGLRLFHDRMVNEFHQQWSIDNLIEVAQANFSSIDVAAATEPPVFFSNLISKDYVPVKEKELHGFIQSKLKSFVQEEMDSKLVLSSQMLDHVLRIDRVLKQYQGHLLIVGPSGSGKNVLTHFVSWLNGLHVYRVRVHRRYTMENFDNDLRDILRKVGTQGERYTFMLDQSELLDSSFLERINTLLANGEIPGLFEGEDYLQLMSQARDAAGKEGFMPETSDDLYKWFTKTVCKNLHVVYTMVPTLDGLKDCPSTSPALFNRCVINWLGDWSSDTYYKTGLDFIKELKLNSVKITIPPSLTIMSDLYPSDKAGLTEVIVNACLYIHETSIRYSAVLRKRGMATVPITPRHFQDLYFLYVSMVKEMGSDISTQQGHLKKGVDKIKQTVNSVSVMEQELKKNKADLQEINVKAEQKMKQIQTEQVQANVEKQKVEQLTKKLAEKMVFVNEKKAAVSKALETVEPKLREGREAVQNIRKEDIRELKALKNPPVMVKLALESTLFLMGEKSTEWKNTLAVIQKDNFIGNLLTFDAETVTSDTAKAMQKYLTNPDFTFEKVYRASVACGPMVKWVTAQVEYATILSQCEPLRNEMKSLEADANKMKTEAKVFEDKVVEIENMIKGFKVEYDSLMVKVTETKKNLEAVEKKVERAMSLLQSLEGEKKRWSENIDDLEDEKVTIYGRCILGAAMISYSGFFTEMVRLEMFRTWAKFLISSGVQLGKNIVLTSDNVEEEGMVVSLALTQYLSTADERLDWREKGLPADQLSDENAVILTRCRRYPLIIDPSGQATVFLLNKVANIKKFSILDPAFRKNIEIALRLGTIVLVEDVDTYDPLLNPILDKEIKHMAGRDIIEIADSVIDYSPTFKIYLATSETTKEFAMDLVARVTMVNFTITRNSLKSQCFDMTLKSERPDVDKRKTEYFKLMGDFRNRLRKLEKRLLDVLAKAEGNILENDMVISEMTSIKKEVAEINSKMGEADTTRCEIEKISQEYYPIGTLCSDIFFMLDSFWKIHFLYYFTLHFFLKIVHAILEEDPILKQEKDFSKRTKIIKIQLCKMIYNKAAPSLLQEHKILFAILLAFFHLKEDFVNHPTVAAEFQTFWLVATDMIGSSGEEITGPVIGHLSEDQSNYARNAMANTPGYETWENKSKSGNFDAWLKSGLPEREPFVLWDQTDDSDDKHIGGINETVRKFLKSLTLMQAFRPDRLIAAMENFVKCLFGNDFFVNEEGLMQFSKIVQRNPPNTPILLCAVTGMDASSIVEDGSAELKQTLRYTAIGSAEGFVMADKHLKICAEKGFWLLLKNVHLAPNWLLEMDKKIRDMKVHANFRCFMTSEISPKLPVTVVRNALVFTIELPPGFKANLIRSLHGVNTQLMETKPSLRANMYFLIVWLHAVIQERLRYTGVGWTKFYEFSESDIKCACSTIDSWITKNKCSDGKDIPWEAICSLMSSCIYGGKMDNHVDHRLLQNLVQETLSLTVIKGNKALITTSSAKITIPALDTKEAYLSWIKKQIPENERPSWLGLSDNANLVLLQYNSKKLMLDYKKIMTSLSSELVDLSIVGRRSRIRVRMASVSEKPQWMNNLLELAQRWSGVLPESIELLQRNPERIADPLFRFFDRETCIAFNTLENINGDFKMVINMIENNQKLTAEELLIIESLQSGFPPKRWVPCVISTGMSSNKWLASFNERVKQLNEMQDHYRGSSLPKVNELKIWLGGLFMPEAFITATRQSVSQANNVALDELTMQARIVKDINSYKGSSNSFIVTRLQLSGADVVDEYTIALSAKVFSNVPALELSWVKSAERVSAKNAKAQWMNVPIYLNESRNVLLFEVELIAKEDSAEFYKRGVALTCAN